MFILDLDFGLGYIGFRKIVCPKIKVISKYLFVKTSFSAAFVFEFLFFLFRIFFFFVKNVKNLKTIGTYRISRKLEAHSIV